MVYPARARRSVKSPGRRPVVPELPVQLLIGHRAPGRARVQVQDGGARASRSRSTQRQDQLRARATGRASSTRRASRRRPRRRHAACASCFRLSVWAWRAVYAAACRRRWRERCFARRRGRGRVTPRSGAVTRNVPRRRAGPRERRRARAAPRSAGCVTNARPGPRTPSPRRWREGLVAGDTAPDSPGR